MIISLKIGKNSYFVNWFGDKCVIFYAVIPGFFGGGVWVPFFHFWGSYFWFGLFGFVAFGFSFYVFFGLVWGSFVDFLRSSFQRFAFYGGFICKVFLIFFLILLGVLLFFFLLLFFFFLSLEKIKIVIKYIKKIR